MPRRDSTLLPAIRELELTAEGQAWACTADQALSAGVTRAAIARLARSGRWQRLHWGVYALRPSTIGLDTRMWGAHLALGEGSVISGRAAGHAWGLLPGDWDPALPIEAMIPEGLRLRAAGVATRRVPFPEGWAHPARRPPTLTVEHTLLDLVRIAGSDAEAAELVLRACRSRLTTPARIRDAVAGRVRVARRQLLLDVCADVTDGVTSTLERRYHRDVAMRHGLPRAIRQERSRTWSGATVYRDLRYDPFDVIVELDGRLGHEAESAVFRDQYRDNASTLTGAATLRYGWWAVAGEPCEVAAQVGTLLAIRGWSGTPRACRAGCPAGRPRARAA